MHRLYATLKTVAPEADEAIKWGTPFFVEPRFRLAFDAFTAHCSFSPSGDALEVFRKEMESRQTTKGAVKISYNEPLPEDLISRIAEYCLRSLGERQDSAFW